MRKLCSIAATLALFLMLVGCGGGGGSDDDDGGGGTVASDDCVLGSSDIGKCKI